VPPPLLSTLSGRAREAYPIIKGGVGRGLTANQIQTVLRSQGLGIRRQSLLDIVRGVRGIEVAGARLRTLRRNFTPDPRRLPDALTKIRRAFSFEVRISGIDLSTGEDIVRHVSVSLDDPLTRSQIENIGLGFIEEELERYGLAVTDVLLTSGVKAGEEGTLF